MDVFQRCKVYAYKKEAPLKLLNYLPARIIVLPLNTLFPSYTFPSCIQNLYMSFSQMEENLLSTKALLEKAQSIASDAETRAEVASKQVCDTL